MNDRRPASPGQSLLAAGASDAPHSSGTEVIARQGTLSGSRESICNS